MTGTDVARTQEHSDDSWLDVVGPVAKFADYICRTEFVPKAMRGNAAAVTATMLTGRELNMGPLTSLRSLDVIEGNVQMKTKAILARIFKAGHRVEWLESSDKACEVRIERGDGLTTAQARWTMADAQRAELAGKAVWRRYPRAMLRNRALSECAELACPDVILGLEVGDESASIGTTMAAEPSRVVQVAQLPTHPQYAPQAAELTPERPVIDVVDAPEVEEPTPAEDLVTAAQMRKIGALLGELERIDGRKLDREERRGLIAAMAGHPAPDSLQSAKELTKAQASAAIERLTEAVTDGMDAASAEGASAPEADA